MATLLEAKDKVLRLLNDTAGEQFEEDLLIDGISAAHKAVLPWLFKRNKATFEGDEETASFALPSDFYRVISVLDKTEGIFIPHGVMGPNTRPADNVVINNDWTEYPSGYMSFANAPEGDVDLFYGAYWTEPATDSAQLEVPDCLITPMILYATSYALLQKAVASSNIRQWNVQVDSGTPSMNPMRDTSQYLLERFKIEMSLLPAILKGSQ